MAPNAVEQRAPEGRRARWLPFTVAALLTAAMLGWQGVHLYGTFLQASHKESGTCVTKLAEAVYFTGHRQMDLVTDLGHEMVLFGNALNTTSLDSWQTEYARSAAELEANLEEALTSTRGEVRQAIEQVQTAYRSVDRDVDEAFGIASIGTIEQAAGFMTAERHAAVRTDLRLALGELVTALDRHIAQQVSRERSDELVSVAGAVALFVAAIGAWIVFARRIRSTELDLAAEADRRKIAQRDLERAQRMEALSVMAGGVAHDFENLTSVIWGSAASARAHLDERDHLEAALARIELAAEDAGDLVNGLLSFARRRPPVRVAFELGSFVRASEPLVRAALPGDVQLQIHIAGDVWVDGDEQQLRQALLNLVVNGGEAMGGSGILTITVDRTGSGDALLTVSDTGTGMTADVREHVFDPFFTTREDGRGTGLGLPIVRSIVADHGGTVAVDSKPGRGSTFAITLPGTSPPAEMDLHTPGGTVLLVAPQGYAGELVAEGLRRHGDTVLSATTVEEAADHWSSLPVDVLVIDHRVGDVLGRSGRPQVPTVLTVDPGTPIPAGVFAVVEPYTLDDLHRAIDQALGFQPAGDRR